MLTVNSLNLKMNLLVFILFGVLSFSSAFQEVVSPQELDARLAEAGDNIVLAAFTAIWCGPCRFILPAMQKLYVELPSVVYLTMDIDQPEDINRYFGIRTIPTIIVFRNSQKIDHGVARNES